LYNLCTYLRGAKIALRHHRFRILQVYGLRHKERDREALSLEHSFTTLLFPENAGQFYTKWQEDALQKLDEFPVIENI